MAAWEALSRAYPQAPATRADGLTICSVAFRAKECLDLNDRLMRQLNPDGARPEWLLFDNNTDAGERIDPADSRFTVVKPAAADGFVLGYEHAIGVAALLARVRTRFLLILDPDCFIVRPEWVRDVPAHMRQKGLGFFGTPINPRRYNSYRYFPYMVCMFVDLERVSLADLCFVPDVWRLGASLGYGVRKAFTRIPKAGYAFRWLLTERYKTNGFRLRERFGDGRSVPFECAQPVWDVDAELAGGGRIKKLIYAMTPASVSPIPKQPGYCTPRGFASAGAPDVAALGWEEFMWRDQPFAFHVGSVHAKGGYIPALTDAIGAFSRDLAGAR
jgi:hypothetical protein